ncbi:IPTL-CTERM sorting domain-containing protein [Comamonas sp. 4034]|uniref:IPTL-CTERM sorting domain-containing protein n=1 Tax=Comamonas sp. 4034 TaxID=3156455 RepID=UPI003D196327
MKKIPRTRVLCAAMLVSAAAHAETPVAANSQYFTGWKMAKFVTAVPTPTAGTPINATIGGTPFTINTVGTAPTVWATWGSGQSTALMSSTDLPANIGLPTDPGNVWEVGGGDISMKFQAPMVVGTTLFSHDFDSADAMEYRFYRCDGTQVDASLVEYLQIATANNPVQTPPVAGATDSFWKLASPTTGPLGGTTAGLVVKATDVCEIRAKELGLPRHSTIDLMLGIPPTPNPVADTSNTVQGQPVTIDVRANDTTSSPPATLAPPTITQPPANGTVTIDGSGKVVYTPNAGFSGTDTFTYQVCVQTAPTQCKTATVSVNVLGVTATADSATTKVDTPVTVGILANDASTDPANAPLAGPATAVSAPAHGMVVYNADGTATYTPAAGFTGTDTFEYQICTAQGTYPAPACATAKVTVVVTSSVTPPAQSNPAPVPTLGEWSLFSLTSLVALFGISRIRRRQT